eukprot:5892489-Alexandrium_andersonii.AAC.1
MVLGGGLGTWLHRGRGRARGLLAPGSRGPRGLAPTPPAHSDGMLAGALDLVPLGAEHSQTAGATAALFRSLPA